MPHRSAPPNVPPDRLATAALATEEAALARWEADAQTRLSNVEEQEEAVARAVEEQRRALARQTHPLLAPFVTEALGELPTLGVRPAEPTAEQTRAFEARRAAVELRKKMLEAEERVLAARKEMLARARERLASAQRAAHEVEAKALELARMEEEAARRKAEAPRPLAPAHPSVTEQRKARRVRVTTEVSLSSETNFWTGFSSDLSEGGIFVATADLRDPGTEVDLSFSLEGSQTIEARGIVRWVRALNARTPQFSSGMGIEFVELPAEAVQAIRAFASQREPLFFA